MFGFNFLVIQVVTTFFFLAGGKIIVDTLEATDEFLSGIEETVLAVETTEDDANSNRQR